MKLRYVEVDQHLREAIHYKDMTFPVDIWTDDYNMLVNRTLNCHWHAEFEFGVMLSGEVDYYINGVHTRLQKGDGIFVNANTLHMATQCAGCHDAVMFTIVFPASLLGGSANASLYQKYFQPLLGKALHGFKIENNGTGKHLNALLKDIYALDATKHGYELQCLALLCQVWAGTLRYIEEYNGLFVEGHTDRKHEKTAKDILSYIHGHYTEHISIDDMARHANISRSECFRCFKRFTNKKPMAYINEYRLAHAAIMLKEGSGSVAEIGNACGFTSSSYFCKLFREKYATTPLAYRHTGLS